MTFEDVLLLANGKTEYKIICPFHVTKQHNGELGPEKTASCGVNTDKHVFKCFGCNTKGSFIKLKVLLEGGSWEQARWDLYQGKVPDSLIKSFQEEIESTEELIYPESSISFLSPAGEIKERNIEESESKIYGILSDTEGNTYLPIRDRTHRLRGCQIRYNHGDEEGPRYSQHLRLKKGRHLFGEHLVNTNADFRLILCEGPLDAVRLYGVLQVPVFSYLGSHISDYQKESLNKLPLKEIILWGDNDEAGKGALKANYNKIKQVSPLITSVQYQVDDPKDPCDSSDDIIRRLYAERVWVPSK